MPKRELFNRQGDALMMIYRLSGRVPEWRLGGSPVRESRPPGFVRGVLRNGHPYRDSDCGEVMGHGCGAAEIHLDRGSAMCPSGNRD